MDNCHKTDFNKPR
jgi:hypothetical protein